MAKSNKSSGDSKKARPIQNLPPKDPKSDDRIKGGAMTEGVKKTMQTQV
jgi:hypothetical protein